MTKTELFAYMEEVVDKYVEMYKTDLDIDKEIIGEWSDGKCWGVWLVRDHGTQISRFTNNVESMTWVEAVFEQMTVLKTYIIRKSGESYEILESDLGEIRNLYKKMDKYRIELFATETYDCLVRDVTGAFDSDKKATEFGEWLSGKTGAGSFIVTALRRPL